MKIPPGSEEASEPRMFIFPDKHQHSQGWVPHPCWARGRTPEEEQAFCSQGRRPNPALPGADVGPGGVFFSFSYLKKKQNSPHSPHVKCLSCSRQTIILQSHNDPCVEKKRKSLHPAQSKPGRVNLWKSPGRGRSSSLTEEQQEVGRQAGERMAKEEA